MRLLLPLIAAGAMCASCAGDDAQNSTATPDDVTQGVFIHSLLAKDTFGVVFAGMDEPTARAAWRQVGTLRRWDYVLVEHGAPTGGAFMIVNRRDEGTTGQRCLWARTLDRAGKFYLTCSEGTRGIGPGLGAWEALLAERADEPVGDRHVIGERATCWRVNNLVIAAGSVCLSQDGVPLVLDVLRASRPVSAGSFEAIERLDSADIDLSYPVITRNFEGRVDLEKIGLPP